MDRTCTEPNAHGFDDMWPTQPSGLHTSATGIKAAILINIFSYYGLKEEDECFNKNTDPSRSPYRKNKWSAIQSCGEYLSCYSNRHRRGTNGRIFAASVLKNLGYLRLPGRVTLLEILQIFSWGSMKVQTKPEVLSSSMLFVCLSPLSDRKEHRTFHERRLKAALRSQNSVQNESLREFV